MHSSLRDIINILKAVQDALIEGRITVTEANKITKACRKAMHGGGGLVGAGIDSHISSGTDLRLDHESASRLFGPWDSSPQARESESDPSAA
jgi:hypothetical protein